MPIASLVVASLDVVWVAYSFSEVDLQEASE